MIKFKNDMLGICDVMIAYGNVYLLKSEKGNEKYIVTVDLDIYAGNWRCGNYFKAFNDALKLFKELISFYTDK